MRKLKRKEKLAKKKRCQKKRATEAQQKSGGKKKKRGRAYVKVQRPGGGVKPVECLLNESPKAELAPG